MATRTSIARTLTIFGGIVLCGAVALAYSAYLLAGALLRIGSGLVAGFVEGLATLAVRAALEEVAMTFLVWATRGPIPALMRAAGIGSGWGIW